MTDQLHDRLADALRDVYPHAPWVLSGKIKEALAAYETAKSEPAIGLITQAQAEQYIRAADDELGPYCCDPWVEECRRAIRSLTQAKKEPVKQMKLPEIDLTYKSDGFLAGWYAYEEKMIAVIKAQGLEAIP